ncbi:protein indeterminate-domain 12-like [Impatiens glandulifera]|uniref:protein indeterminate-domain 12-like n=1 Tax=Impatiens glandulifera TaxID=253017 RepID=UPI001FB11773|nr:protein indeterminate-domain 12-like [Impatiens glandulifera]
MSCLLSCNTELYVIAIALVLSQNIDDSSAVTPKSLSCCWIQRSCAQQLPATRYSASAVDVATECLDFRGRKDQEFIDSEMASSSRVTRTRNPPGTPDPDAEVISLSPNRLLSTHSFVCQVCYKGFQREQNLHLHLKSHNMDGNLRPRLDNGNRRRVYVCPERTCKHHHRSRALGDVTAIRRHYSRKHSNEKKWKCGKCSKLYAVEADLKAHMKKCKVYLSDCDQVVRSSATRIHCNALSHNPEGYVGGSSSTIQRSQLQPPPPPLVPFTVAPAPSSPLMPHSTSSLITNFPYAIDSTPAYNGTPLEFEPSLPPHSYIPPYFLTGNSSSFSGVNQQNTMGAVAPCPYPYDYNAFMDPEVNTAMGTPAGKMINDGTSQPEISDHHLMLAAMEEAMGLNGISTGVYQDPFSGDDNGYF